MNEKIIEEEEWNIDDDEKSVGERRIKCQDCGEIYVQDVVLGAEGDVVEWSTCPKCGRGDVVTLSHKDVKQ